MESLEEAAKKHADSYYNKNSEFSSVIFESVEWSNRNHNFIEGAKWQAENMPIHILDVDNIKVSIQEGIVIVEKNDKTLISYSEEEVINAFNEGQALNVRGKLIQGKEWFEQFKKK